MVQQHENQPGLKSSAQDSKHIGATSADPDQISQEIVGSLTVNRLIQFIPKYERKENQGYGKYHYLKDMAILDKIWCASQKLQLWL